MLYREKKKVIALLLIGLAFALILFPQRGQAANEYIMLMDADGAIVPAMENYFDRALDQAEDDNVALVIIQLDTPGGSVATTEEMVQRIRTADVPVVVYVSPHGAMAASAGSLITLSGHVSAMAPETVIGAASPINGNGTDLNETADKKAKEILTANMRSLTENRSPEAQQLAQEMITDARAVTATEALDIGLIDYIATSTNDLIAQMDGTTVTLHDRSVTLALAGLETRSVDMSMIEQLLLILTDPTLVFMLLSVGVLLVIIEFRAPGGWVAGTLGATCIALSLYGLGVLPINLLGLVFVGLAVVLFALEIHIPGTQGALTAAAAISLAAGGLIMFNRPQVREFGGISVAFVIAQSIGIGIFGAIMVNWLIRTVKHQPITGEAGMVGMVGKARTALAPQGMIFVNGERWRAETTEGIHVEQGQPVRVVSVADLLLMVEPVDNVIESDKKKNT